ncbi:Lrp/AsnC family transcriptional regulator [Methanocella conradii]|uniref:Lrp/AsnC family transcriptional regulator n=1 Tax=Methanocella conradii TaxID=1175444 RepID=UPI0024B32DA4|nr:Lrp/AsnC family transcriptional regulator [Methanocella conradii]MDI6896131.1 Lrp/AsnC family transcriptional regulator [Methanocella conradii]
MDNESGLDDTDLSILRLLRENARMSYLEMSRRTGIADATIQHRLKRMIKKGLVKLTVRVDPVASGYGVMAVILVQTDTEKHDEAKNSLASLPEVTEVYSVLGEYDLMIKVWAKSLDELNRTINDKIRGVDGVEDLAEMVMVERVKEEGPPM